MSYDDVWGDAIAWRCLLFLIMCLLIIMVDSWKVIKYDQEMPQTHNTDQNMALWGRDTEHLQ